MNRYVSILALIAGCSAENPGGGFQLDGGNGSTDLAGADLAGSMSGGHCPCAGGNYCDLATNVCKPGCAFDTDCNGQHCDTSTHQCVTIQRDMAGWTNSDLGITASCMGPADCNGGSTPLCCAHLDYGPSPSCTRTANVRCEATCPFQFPAATCNAMGEAQVCQQKADCNDPAAANCCSFTALGMSGSFCVSDQYKQFGTCL